mgnify:CR=1 FL=1
MTHALTRAFRSLLAALSLALLAGCFTSPPDGVRVVSPFDLQRYLGTWYEVARLDHRFERGLVDVSATYRLDADDQAFEYRMMLRTLKTEYDTEGAALKPQIESLTPEAIAANPTLKARVEGLNRKAAELMQKQNALNQTLEQREQNFGLAFLQVLGPAIDTVAKEAGADVVDDARVLDRGDVVCTVQPTLVLRQ